jgi:hypothetical protein
MPRNDILVFFNLSSHGFREISCVRVSAIPSGEAHVNGFVFKELFTCEKAHLTADSFYDTQGLSKKFLLYFEGSNGSWRGSVSEPAKTS